MGCCPVAAASKGIQRRWKCYPSKCLAEAIWVHYEIAIACYDTDHSFKCQLDREGNLESALMQHHITIPIWLAKWILARKNFLIVAVGLITILAGWRIRETPFSISALESFTSDFTAFNEYQQRAAQFGGDSDMLVFIAGDEGDQLFTSAKLNALRRAAEELVSLPEVIRVVALTEVAMPTNESAGGGPSDVVQELMKSAVRSSLVEGQVPPIPQDFRWDPWWPQSPDAQQEVDLAAVRERLRHDPFLAGRLLSHTGTAHCTILQLDSELVGLGAKWRLRQQIDEIYRKQGLGQNEFHVSGLTISEGWILSELVSCLQFQLPLGIAIIAAIVYGLFRSLAIAALTIIVGAIAAVWAIAVTGLVFGKITILVAAVPLLILVISTSDTIHIVSAFGRELEKGLSRDQALQQVICDVGGACLLTSVTTLVGFLSLLLIPVTAIRHLAVTAGVGVGLSLILAISIVPIGIRILHFTPPSKAFRADSLVNRLIHWLIEMLKQLSMQHPRFVVAANLILIATAAAYATNLKFDPNLIQRFDPGHPMPISTEYFNENFFGTNVVEVFVSGNPERLLDPQNLERLNRLRERLLELPEIHSVTGINDLFLLLDRLIDFQTDNNLPLTQPAADASLRLMSKIQPDLVKTMITPDQRILRISTFTSLSGFFEVLKLAEQVQQIVSEEIPEELDGEVTGVMPVIASSVERIVDSQLTGLTFCFSVVLLIVIVALRSVRLGLLSLLPNLMPLLLLAGCLGFASGRVDSDYIIVFTIAFGIAVDDTIHFLHRYDVEFSHCGDRRRALDFAYGYSGRAIVQTTVVLGMGLLPLALSNYLTIWMLGTYLVLTLVFAVLADLLFLPALILLFGE